MVSKTFSVGSLAYQSDSNAYILELVVSETAVSAAHNTSTLSYRLQLRSGGSNRFQWSITAGATIGSTTVTPVTANKYLDYNSVWTLLSGTVTAAHNADGTKTLPVSAYITVPSGNSYAPPSLSLSGSLTLTPIPRQSTVSATDAAIGSKSTVVIASQSAAFTHTVHYSFGSLSGYLADATGTLSATAVKLSDRVLHFPLPTDFYGQLPAATSGVCTLTVTTYSGTTQIGSAQSTTFRASTTAALCAPTVSGTVADCNEKTLALTGDAATLVRYRSTARCTLTAAARWGSSLTATTIAGVSGTERDIAKIATTDIAFRAVDSRGYSTTAKPTGLTLLPYVPLSLTPRLSRPEPTGSTALLTVTGACYSGSFGLTDNAITATWQLGDGEIQTAEVTVSGGSYRFTATLTELDYRSQYPLTVTVSDKLDTVTRSLTVPKGVPVFDWGESDFAFHVPLTIQDSPLADFVVAQGSTGIWQYRKWQSGIAECWGTKSLGSVAITRSWGSVYLSPEAVYSQSLPDGLFAAVPACVQTQVLDTGGGSCWLLPYGGVSATNAGQFLLARGTAATLPAVKLSFYVKGKWKE